MSVQRAMEGDLLVLEDLDSGEKTRLRESVEGDCARIQPIGKLSSSLAHDLEDEMTSIALACGQITLDLSQVPELANSVLRVILEIQHLVDSREGNLTICGVNDRIWETIEELGLEDVFEIRR